MTVPDLRKPTGFPSRPQPPTGPSGSVLPRFQEPPVLRTTPAGSARVCTNCSAPVTFPKSPPLCWGCGRTLCVDCYWRHGLTPAAHTCQSCRARGVTAPATSRSGAHSTGAHAPGSRPPTSP
ncbi:MAG TPA: hypothetical protein VMI55_07455 [Thermoplasmata archaeon]|nr:hypothetical protein [Thermoplasmata archaeon]